MSYFRRAFKKKDKRERFSKKFRRLPNEVILKCMQEERQGVKKEVDKANWLSQAKESCKDNQVKCERMDNARSNYSSVQGK